MKPAMTAQQARYSSARSPLALYREHAVGDVGWAALLYYEASQLFFSNLPGVLGFALRALFYPALFRESEGRPAIGRSVVLRNPKKISLGRGCLLDDFAVLDARGAAARIELGECVSLGRGSALVAKDASISLGRGVNIGSNCRIATQSRIEIGESVLIAAYAYIGPGNHRPGDAERPLIAQEMETRGGVKIGAHAWIGTRATILDGVTIGEGAIVGAHSLVREDVPAGATVAGSPARVISPPRVE